MRFLRPLHAFRYFVIPIVLFAGFLVAQATPRAMSDVARIYLGQVLDLMQQKALNRDSVDWVQVRRETITRAANAQTTFDTYPAIAYALTRLKEHHSFLQLPDSLSSAQKQSITNEMAEIRSSEEQTYNHSISTFSPSKEIRGHTDSSGGKVFAHIVVPMCVPQYTDWAKNAPYFQDFANKLHQTVVDLQAQNPDGWILDLRGNGGGNMWPMLAGIGALLGEGDLGAFESPGRDRVSWFYKGGKAGTREPHGEEGISAEVKEPPFTFPELPWVAVLLDQGTASSGEAVAISFAARPKERSFGQHTGGFSTSNDMHPLPDGASLFLCEGVEADRTGKRYPDGIEPDVKVPAPLTRPKEEADLAFQAAVSWLAQQKN